MRFLCAILLLLSVGLPLRAQLLFSADFDSNLLLSAGTGYHEDGYKMRPASLLEAGLELRERFTGSPLIYLSQTADMEAWYRPGQDPGLKFNELILSLHLLPLPAGSAIEDAEGTEAAEGDKGDKGGDFMTLGLGRFIISDASGRILHQQADGLSFELEIERFRFGLSGGYLGWVPPESGEILRMIRSESSPSGLSDGGSGADGRLILFMDAELAVPVAGLRLGLQAGGQYDLEDDGNGIYHSWIAGLRGEGAFLASGSYQLQVDVNAGYGADGLLHRGIAVQPGVEYLFLVPTALRPFLELSWMSGEAPAADGSAGSPILFNPLSAAESSGWFQAPFRNLSMLRLGIDWQPGSLQPTARAQSLLLGLSQTHFWNSSRQQDSIQEIVSGPSGYYGFETAIDIEYLPVSDIGLGFTGGIWTSSQGNSPRVRLFARAELKLRL